MLKGYRQSGFTLVEMVVVIVITGIIGGMVAMFIRAPVQGYIDSARRAELTDIADTAIRRMARDVRTAVPNSVRPQGQSTYIEFLPTKDGGRYRANAASSGTSAGCGSLAADVLDFTIADTCFGIIGTAIPIVRGATDDTSDQIVVGSTQSSGAPPYDKTYAGNGVRRPYTGTTGSPATIQILNVQFPPFSELSSQRFDEVDGTQQAVTYSCEGTLLTLDANGNGQASLVKHWTYGFNTTQVAPASLVGSSAILADKLSDCQITYDVPNQRFGLLTVRLTLTSGNDSVSLYNEIHVNNVP